MNNRSKIVAAALSGCALFALSAMNASDASARIVCNEDACWHVHEDYAFPPGVRVEVHPDNWRWRDGDHFVWREHPGRGYWHGNEWRDF